ncbi:MAG: DNA repair protein RecN [Bacteroidota bacterium]|nr:DNA repair protein RecN [Bacteroidota bacterium]
MLLSLKIQNYALIKDLEIDFSSGLITITGETGAGKSIIIGAIGLLSGNRAETSVMRYADKKCVVEGTFSIANYNLQGIFLEHDLDYEEISLIRREISTGGRSRSFINDTPVNLIVLKAITDQLIDVHSQRHIAQLMDINYQIEIVDIYAGNGHLLEEYKLILTELKKTSFELRKLEASTLEAKKELDYNEFQYNELSKLNIQDKELEQLEEEQTTLSNAGNILNQLNSINDSLANDEQSIINQLSQNLRLSQSLVGINSNLADIYNRINSQWLELKELNSDISNYADSINADDNKLILIDERLTNIYALYQKHQINSFAEYLEKIQYFEGKIKQIESIDDQFIELKDSQRASKTKLVALAERLHSTREHSAKLLSEEMVTRLKQIGIPDAQIQLEFSLTKEVRENGLDNLKFLFSANKGIGLDDVVKVASGGEMSRIMLVIKAILSDKISLPTIIFDEIDTGISGTVSVKVGEMMKKMAIGKQVFAITHQPQVAAKGNSQYRVYKDSTGNSSATYIKELNDNERIIEIANMISGQVDNLAAQESARQLLAAV